MVVGCRFLVVGCRLLVIGFWLSVGLYGYPQNRAGQSERSWKEIGQFRVSVEGCWCWLSVDGITISIMVH